MVASDLVEQLRNLYEGECQICGWAPRNRYGTELCEAGFTKTLGIALTRFRKLDDLASDHLTNWISVVGSGGEGRKGRLESEAHETDSLKVERLAIQEARLAGR